MLLVMVLAMMLPLVARQAQGVARQNARGSRHSAIADFLAGYLLVTATGTLGLAAAVAAGDHLSAWGTGAAATIAGGGWELSRARQRWVARCEPPTCVAPPGWRARDRARFGARVGVRCFAACWASMLACVVFAHDPPVTVVTFVVQLLGRRHPTRRGAWLGALAVVLACVAAPARRRAHS